MHRFARYRVTHWWDEPMVNTFGLSTHGSKLEAEGQVEADEHAAKYSWNCRQDQGK